MSSQFPVPHCVRAGKGLHKLFEGWLQQIQGEKVMFEPMEKNAEWGEKLGIHIVFFYIYLAAKKPIKSHSKNPKTP